MTYYPMMPRSSTMAGATIGRVTPDNNGKLWLSPDPNRAYFFFGRHSQDPTNRSFNEFSDDWFTEIVVGPNEGTACDTLMAAMKAKHWNLVPDLFLSSDYSCTEHSRQVRLISTPSDAALYRVLIVDEDEPRPPATRLVRELWVYGQDVDVTLDKIVQDIPRTLGNKTLNAQHLKDGVRPTFPTSL